MKRNKREEKVRKLTPEELAEEEKRYQACKKPVQVGWAIYVFAATLYLCSGFFAKRTVDKIPQKQPIVDSLNEYKNCDEYVDFVTDIQKTALDQFVAGEITIDEYQHVIETTKDDETFEKFLRSLENDKYVQQTIAEYDNYEEAMNSISKKYSALSITALSSLLVSTLILAKYRFREMDIEAEREKRAKIEDKPLEPLQ